MRPVAAKLYDNNEVVFVFIDEVWGKEGQERLAYSELRGYHQIKLEDVSDMRKPGLSVWYPAFQGMKASINCNEVTIIEGVI